MKNSLHHQFYTGIKPAPTLVLQQIVRKYISIVAANFMFAEFRRFLSLRRHKACAYNSFTVFGQPEEFGNEERIVR